MYMFGHQKPQIMGRGLPLPLTPGCLAKPIHGSVHTSVGGTTPIATSIATSTMRHKTLRNSYGDLTISSPSENSEETKFHV